MIVFYLLALFIVSISSYLYGKRDQKKRILFSVKIYSPIDRSTLLLPKGDYLFKTDKEYNTYIQIFNDTKENIIQTIKGVN